LQVDVTADRPLTVARLTAAWPTALPVARLKLPARSSQLALNCWVGGLATKVSANGSAWLAGTATVSVKKLSSATLLEERTPVVPVVRALS